MMNTNTLLIKSSAPFGAPEFDKIDKEDYLPAFEICIEEVKKEIDGIVDNADSPDFINTIESLEYSGRRLSDLEGIFFNLLEADTDELMQDIAEKVSPKLTELQMYISLNEKLFERVKSVYLRQNELNLSIEQKRLLEDTYKSFSRNGAELSPEDKKLYGEMMEKLSLLELKFGNNVLSATNSFEMLLSDEKDLEGLPDYVVKSSREAAEEKGKEGWLFTLHFPSYSPFMKFSSKRELRKKMYMAYSSRAIGGEFDNTKVVPEIVDLRIKVAQLLGYKTYADYVLERRMAKNRNNVDKFLDELMSSTLSKAREEVSELLDFAIQNGFEEEQLQPWDFSYWVEKMQQQRYSIDEEILKPYFRLENCIEAIFDLAGRLYGIIFSQVNNVPVYHKDVKVYEVKDEHGEHLALFYADFFPRASKRGGAWMTEFRGQFVKDGQDFRPFISIVTNFSKPFGDTPSLLTHDEFTTLLHEFGHSLHGMLSRGKYSSMSGTNVARDFVELPSQIMENWAYEPEYLNTFARHYITGETMPSELIDKIVEAKNFMAGYYQVRQLQFGKIDMAWHSLENLPSKGVIEFESEILDGIRTLPSIPGLAVSPSFNHIFSGGYSAGYYGYKWAEVLDADAFEYFKEKGIFNREVAESFRKNILEKGSTEDEADLYRRFRGRDADPDALLRRMNLK